MHQPATAVPRPRPEPPAAERAAALYRKLQDERDALAARVRGPYPPGEFVRHAQEGSIKFHDALILAELLEEHRPARILEVGSFIGFSTRWLLEISRPWDAAVTAVDPGIRHRVFDRPGDVLRQFNAAFLPGRLVVQRGFFSQPMAGDWCFDYQHYQPFLDRQAVDAIMHDTPVLTGKDLTGGPFDLVFIDGDHLETSVLANFREALAVLAPRGRIAFHDAVTWPDVSRALGRIARDHADLGSVDVLGADRQQPDVNVCDGIGVFSRR
jgi:predicted O-methyltransferase YrrM